MTLRLKMPLSLSLVCSPCNPDRQRDAVDALSVEIRALLEGELKGRRVGVAELRKKMESQSDIPVRLITVVCLCTTWVVGVTFPS